MREPKLLDLIAIATLLFAASCKDGSPNRQTEADTCYYVLDFSDLPTSQHEKLSELSLNIHGNYFMYKNLDVIPLRFNERIFMSLDCDRGVEALELDEWMREMIKQHTKINSISEEQYNSMYKKSTSGKIIVE